MPAFDRRRRSPLRGRVATRARRVDATLSASAGVATARAPGRGRGVSIARPLAGPASAGKQPDPKSCSLRWPRIPSALVDPQQNATRPWTLLLVSASTRSSSLTAPNRAAPRCPFGTPGVTPTDRGNGCPSARGMQHSGAADGPVSSTVSQARAGCKQKSGSVGAVGQTAGVGAKRSRSQPCRSCDRRCDRTEAAACVSATMPART
jgi:hypothetical protein